MCAVLKEVMFCVTNYSILAENSVLTTSSSNDCNSPFLDYLTLTRLALKEFETLNKAQITSEENKIYIYLKKTLVQI